MSGVREEDGFSVIAEIDVNNGPIGGIAASEDGKRVMVTNRSGDSVSIVDTGARAVVSTISGTPEPFTIAVGGRDRACVSSASATCDAIAVLDLRAKRVVAVHPVAFHTTDVAVSPNASRVYCGATAGGRAGVAALDTTTGAGDIVTISAPGTTADGVRISPDGRRLYVAAHGPSSDQLVLMETRQLRVIGSVEIGSPIRDVAVSSSGDTVYVASCSPDFGAVLDVINTRSGMIAGTAKITGAGGFVTQLALSADGERAYLVNDHGVTVLSTVTLDVIGSLTISGSPSCVVENAGGTRLCVADYAGVVTVVSIPSTSVRADDDITARYEWAVPELHDLAPVMA